MRNSMLAVMCMGMMLVVAATGMYIYTSSQSTITDAMSSMSTQEIQAFNSGFTSYQGVQTGSQVRALLTYCSANAKTYEDEGSKVPTVMVGDLLNSKDDSTSDLKAVFDEEDSGDADALSSYVKTISKMSNALELKHSYRVVLTNGSSGLVEIITINYDKDDTDSHEND